MDIDFVIIISIKWTRPPVRSGRRQRGTLFLTPPRTPARNYTVSHLYWLQRRVHIISNYLNPSAGEGTWRVPQLSGMVGTTVRLPGEFSVTRARACELEHTHTFHERRARGHVVSTLVRVWVTREGGVLAEV